MKCHLGVWKFPKFPDESADPKTLQKEGQQSSTQPGRLGIIAVQKHYVRKIALLAVSTGRHATNVRWEL